MGRIGGACFDLGQEAGIVERRARTEGQEAKRPRHAEGVPLARRGRFGRCQIRDLAKGCLR